MCTLAAKAEGLSCAGQSGGGAGGGAAGSSPWPKDRVLWEYRWVDMSQEGRGLQGQFKGN